MDDLPFETPILLRSHHGTDLVNQIGMEIARSRTTTNQGRLESMVLRKLDNGDVAIQCFRNQRFLEVDASGNCGFAAVSTLDESHMFRVEAHVVPDTENHLFFVSRYVGKVLQSNSNGDVWCENCNRLAWEAWTILDPLAVLERKMNEQLKVNAKLDSV